MKIYTITLNPAFDVHASAQGLSVGRENLACVTSRDAGGKGINISRALSENGVENVAVAVLGRENSADFKALIREYGIDCVFIEKPGRIRENLTIHTDGGETRISFEGFSLDGSVLREVESLIQVDDETIVTFTGSVPRGVGIGDCKSFLASLKAKGARIVIDSKSFTLDDLVEVKPWLIKPNGEEISVYFCSEVEDFEDRKLLARRLCDSGIENVMISLGEKGAMLVNSEAATVAEPPVVDALSTVGAGDSTIAGFIAAFCEGKSAEECLMRAVSFGTAACLSDGTAPPRANDVSTVFEKIRVCSL